MSHRVRRSAYLATRVAQVTAKALPFAGRGRRSRILFYPVFADIESLRDQISRVRWYLPPDARYEVLLPVTEQLLSTDLDALEPPEFHRSRSGSRVVARMIAPGAVSSAALSADLICVWDMASRWPPSLVSRPWRIRIVDPDYFRFSETHTYPGLLWHDLLDGKTRRGVRDEARGRLKDFFQVHHSAERSFVFGTGPSVEAAWDQDFGEGVRIVCNSMVKNRELLQHIRPHVIAFTDSVFHFGISAYAEAFLSDLVEAAENYDAMLISNEVGAALVGAHYPQLRSRLVGVPAMRIGKPRPLTPEGFSTRDYTNILTRYMLPLAAGLADDITLMGFDGRDESDERFWSHNTEVQYGTLMESAYRCHPAFFRDIDYREYYRAHCEVLADMLPVYEGYSKTIRVLGTSKIPALVERKA